MPVTQFLKSRPGAFKKPISLTVCLVHRGSLRHEYCLSSCESTDTSIGDYVGTADGLANRTSVRQAAPGHSQATLSLSLTGTLNGATCGGDGSGVSFDGTDDYIDLESFTFGGDLTISTWVRFDDTSSTQMLCAFQQSSEDTLALGMFVFDVSQDPSLRFEFCPSGECTTMGGSTTYVVEMTMVGARSHRCLGVTQRIFCTTLTCPLA